jgi:hypothetical protein
MKKRILTSVLLLTLGLGTAWASDSSRAPLEISGPVHNILSNQLPAALLSDIRKNYKGYWITELYKEGGDKEPSYYITVENADQIVKLNSNDSENWVLLDTIIKPV